MSNIGVAVSTYGSEDWNERGKSALDSLAMQTVPPSQIIHFHDNSSTSLGAVRNHAAAQLDTEWIIFLDADDYLDVNYVAEMSKMAEKGYYDLVQPSTRGYYADGRKDDYPVLIPQRDLMESNYLVIGTMCRRSLFEKVGKFDVDLPVLEDWELWIRMYLDGAVIGAQPSAVYMVGVNEDGRNTVVNGHHQYYSVIRGRYT